MVQSASNRRASISKITKRRVKNKQEMRGLYSELKAVLPSCGDQVCGTDVVIKAVQYINQLHRRVAVEKGVKTLQQIQKNARKLALQQFVAMKAQTIEVSKMF